MRDPIWRGGIKKGAEMKSYKNGKLSSKSHFNFFSLQLSSLSTVTVDFLWNNLCSHFIGI